MSLWLWTWTVLALFRRSLRSPFQNTAKLWRLLSSLIWWIWSLFEQVWGRAWPCLCPLHTSSIPHRSIMRPVKVIDLWNPSACALLIRWTAWSTWLSPLPHDNSPRAFPRQERKRAEKDLDCKRICSLVGLQSANLFFFTYSMSICREAAHASLEDKSQFHQFIW